MHLLTAWPAIRFPIFMYQVDLIILSDFFFGGWRYRWYSGHGKSSSRIRSRFWILKFRYRRKIWHFTLSVQTIDELYLKRQDGQRVVFLVSVLKSRWRSELTHTPVMHAGNEWVCHHPASSYSVPVVTTYLRSARAWLMTANQLPFILSSLICCSFRERKSLTRILFLDWLKWCFWKKIPG